MGNMSSKKLLICAVIIQLIILTQFLHVGNVGGQERVLKVLDLNGSNSITLGSDTELIPPGGIPFTIKVVLEGATNHLNTFQVGLKFNSSILNCTGAWVPKDNPSFVFYGKKFYELKDINNIYDPNRPNSPYPYVMIGAVLQKPGDYVDVSGGLLALINFTALSKGTTTIEFYPEQFIQQHQFTFLLDQYAQDIPYTEGGSFSVTVRSAVSPPIVSFTYSPYIQKDVLADVSRINLKDPTNSKWSGDIEYTCIGWFDYEPHGLNISDILYMRDSFGMNSSWFVLKIGVELDKIRLTLGSWSTFKVKFDASASYDPDGRVDKFVWDFGDGNITETTSRKVDHEYWRRGYYAVNLTVVDNDGMNASITKYVSVGYSPKAQFYTSPVGYPIEAILPGQIVTFNASICTHPENFNITRYIWDFGDGNITETTDPVIVHSYAKRGVYHIKVTAMDIDGLPGSAVREIQVGIPPLARFSFSPTNPEILVIEEGIEVFFDASESQGGEYGSVPIILYKWDFDDGAMEETNKTLVSHAYHSPGEWNVTLTVYDADGLRGTFSAVVPVTYKPTVRRSEFPLYIVAVIIVVVVVAAVIVRRRRAKEEEEVLEI
jgi:PKD repeat protein